ncbi:lasso RiPP family leader peptide-containing protein [Pseudonocardia sp.]|nr:lasso RiPP family leader peptide-containing protein [Pseudonocardia sp.]
MREQYQPPQITELGSVAELTQVDAFAPGSDFTLIGIDLSGPLGPAFS